MQHVLHEEPDLSFRAKTAASLTGLTLSQIGRWDRSHFIKPSLKKAAGQGSGRLYSFVDLVLLSVARMFKDKGVSLRRTRKAISYLKMHLPSLVERPVADVLFITDGRDLFAVTEENRRILDALAQGQLVFALELGKIIEDLKCEVDGICRDRAHKVRVKRRAYDVVLHPDTEAGGYCVACPELLGCDSQGETVEEALEMIKDAIKGHLAVEAKKKKKKAAA